MSSVHENEKHNNEKFKYADVECVEDAGKEEAADAGSSARLDPEVAKYAAGEIVEIGEATNQRLLKMINVRILPVMVSSYFLQSLDKGTMSFSSIMGLPEDAGLVGQQVCIDCPLSLSLTTNVTGTNLMRIYTLLVLLAHDLYLHCCAGGRIPYQLAYPASASCKVLCFQHLYMEYCACLPCSLPQLSGSGYRP